MAQQSFSAAAPGSLMLMGEHAVLARRQALVCAIDKRISVKLTPNCSQIINISDVNLGSCSLTITDLDSDNLQTNFQFVVAAIQHFKKNIKTGFDLQITPEFSSVVGFGSSAAVTVATVSVLWQWLQRKQLPKVKLVKIAREIILAVQKVGSGADVAASVFGGVVVYKSFPLQIIPLPEMPALTAVYCGYKKPTKEVIAIVRENYDLQPEIYESIFSAMQSCVTAAIIAIKESDWNSLGRLFRLHHGLQAALGVSDANLDDLFQRLIACPGIYGAKISGSGLGDCVVGLGALPSNTFPRDLMEQQRGVQQFNINVDKQGLTCANNQTTCSEQLITEN